MVKRIKTGKPAKKRNKTLTPIIDDRTKHRIVEGLRRGMAYNPLVWLCGYYPSEVGIVRAADKKFNSTIEAAIEAGRLINKFDLYVSLVSEGFMRLPAMKLAQIANGWLIHQELARDNTLAGRIAEAEEHATELLEQEAFKRATSGSDLLLMFLLKARKPDKYRESFFIPAAAPAEAAALSDDFDRAKRTAFLLAKALDDASRKQIDLTPNPEPETAPVKNDDAG